MIRNEPESKRGRWLLAPVALVLVAALFTGMLALLSFVWMQCAPAMQSGQHPAGLSSCQMPPSTGLFRPTAKALQDIPQPILNYYIQAGDRFHVPWPILAGIGKAECQHGQSTMQGCHSGANPSGAMGPMQFLQGTWDAFKVAAPGHTVPNVYDSADAIYSAGNYMAHLGAAGVMDLSSPAIVQAIFGYNHLLSYVADVLNYAREYSEPALQGVNKGPFGNIIGITSLLNPLFSWVPQGGFPGTNLFRGFEDQCTYYVAYQWPGREGKGVSWSGNAGAWLTNAAGQGYQISPLPAIGAIAVYPPQSGYSEFGHVAMVTDVKPNSYTVSEQNFQGPGIVDQRVIPWPDGRIGGFIPIPGGLPQH